MGKGSKQDAGKGAGNGSGQEPGTDAGDDLREDSSARDRQAARRKAMDFLARRDYGATELTARLVTGGFDPETAGAAVAQLAAEGLQDDGRFAESLVRSRVRQGKGPVRIRLELEQRGIDPAVCERALLETGEDWRALACQVRERRFGPALPADFPEKARQMRFLQYRGFAPDQVAAAVSGREGP